jgi:SAM-dependent methyltransferase
MLVPTDWWKSFFDGLAVEFWLRMMPEAATRAEADFIEKMLAPELGARLLDVPCGGGRHSIELASRGYRMTGVDISPTFLAAARSQADERKLNVDWRAQPMHLIDFDRQFDGAFCCGNSFGYYDEEGNQAFLRAVARALQPGRRFLLDTSNIAEVLFPVLQERAWFPAGDIYFLQERSYDPARARCDTHYTFIQGTTVENKSASQRTYGCLELCRLVASAGFHDIQTVGSPEGEPFRLGSKRLILVAARD